jgi:hypothetical protein
LVNRVAHRLDDAEGVLGQGLCACNLRESLTGFAQWIEGTVAVLPFEFNSDLHSSPLGWWVILKTLRAGLQALSIVQKVLLALIPCTGFSAFFFFAFSNWINSARD